LQRLKVPPQLHQFQHTLDKNQAGQLLKLLSKYTPETRKDKKDRLKKEAEEAKKDKKGDKKGFKTPKPLNIKYGLNHVTELVESGTAKLVVMAHDVDPIELMIFLPALCRKKGIPFCFVKGKARLGKVVHLKNAACLVVTQVPPEKQRDLKNLQESAKTCFNNVHISRAPVVGGVGAKTQHELNRRAKLAASNK